MAEIIVKNKEKLFEVEIKEAGSSTQHQVTVSKEAYQQLTQGKITPEELIRKSFEFLLKREPKESILSQFDILVIKRYFPEYEQEIKKLVG